MDQEVEEAECEKVARCEACTLKKTATARHKAFTDAQRDTWQAAKLDYEAAVEEWVEDGKNRTKPTHLKNVKSI